MALLADRLELPSVVKITSLNFDSASDAAARESKKALSSASSASPVSILSSLGDSNKSLLDEVSGLFNSILCNGLMPFDLRLDNLLSRLLKMLGLDLDLGLGCLANGLLLDQILGRKPFSFFNSLLGLGNLSFSKQALLTAIFGADFAKLMTLVGYVGSNSCSLAAANSLLNGNLGLSGMGLFERLNMLNMLNSNLGNCSKNTYVNNNNNWTINKISNAVTINQMVMLDPSVTQAYLQKLLGNVPTMTTYDRTAMLSGLGMSMNNSTDTAVIEKLKLLLAINEATTDASQKLLNTGTTMGVTGNVLTALDNLGSNTSTSPTNLSGTVVSSNPAIDLNTILLGLDTLDANWNIDPVTGDTNYSVVSNNSKIVTLAKQVTISTQGTTTIDNEVIATPLNSFQVISLLNTVNEGFNNMNSLVDASGNSLSGNFNTFNNGSNSNNNNNGSTSSSTGTGSTGTGSNGTGSTGTGSTGSNGNGSSNGTGSTGSSNGSNNNNNNNGSTGTGSTGTNGNGSNNNNNGNTTGTTNDIGISTGSVGTSGSVIGNDRNIINASKLGYGTNNSGSVLGIQTLNVNVIESSFNTTNSVNNVNKGLYNNTPLNVLYASNQTIVSCCLKSLCSIS